jgi:DNA-3-methyladenine glycosylase
LFSSFALPDAAERERLHHLLETPAPQAAQSLLGQVLLRRRGRSVLAARIVETEAYLPEGDPAAHCFRGRTPRIAPLFGPAGTVYVYFVYGMHHCLNVVADRENVPGCVLVRAAEFLEPDGSADLDAGRGPGRLCRTLGLTTRASGRHLFDLQGTLTLREGPPPRAVTVTPRIGIRHAADRLLRFVDADSGAVSRMRSALHRRSS